MRTLQTAMFTVIVFTPFGFFDSTPFHVKHTDLKCNCYGHKSHFELLSSNIPKSLLFYWREREGILLS